MAVEDSIMGQAEHDPGAKGRKAWNAGRKPGAKRALKPKEVWAIRFWLDHKGRRRDRAMFDLAIDSKLCGCDVVKLKIGDLVLGGRVRSRATVVQQKTGRPVQFELLDPAQASLQAWLECHGVRWATTSSRAGSTTPVRSARASTPGSWRSGSRASGSATRTTGRTRCGARRRP